MYTQDYYIKSQDKWMKKSKTKSNLLLLILFMYFEFFFFCTVFEYGVSYHWLQIKWPVTKKQKNTSRMGK